MCGGGGGGGAVLGSLLYAGHVVAQSLAASSQRERELSFGKVSIVGPCKGKYLLNACWCHESLRRIYVQSRHNQRRV